MFSWILMKTWWKFWLEKVLTTVVRSVAKETIVHWSNEVVKPNLFLLQKFTKGKREMTNWTISKKNWDTQSLIADFNFDFVLILLNVFIFM